MSLLLPHQMLLHNLGGKVTPEMGRIYIGKEKALDLLRQITGQDFGENVKEWTQWIGQHKDEFYLLMKKKEIKIEIG